MDHFSWDLGREELRQLNVFKCCPQIQGTLVMDAKSSPSHMGTHPLFNRSRFPPCSTTDGRRAVTGGSTCVEGVRSQYHRKVGGMRLLSALFRKR
jgi:hypothetical protein